jgi:FdhD protein
MDNPVRKVDRQIFRDGEWREGRRAIPEETAIALTYNGGAYAVMMGTPQDFRDFAIGFSLNEGIAQSPGDIHSLDIVRLDDGIELRMWLPGAKAEVVNERRRHIAGPTGCGICGIESIAEALRPPAVVPKGHTFSPREIMTAMQAIPPLQHINAETRSVHAAAFWAPSRGIVSLREDVGRHNALDKLAGALAQDNVLAAGRHGAAYQPCLRRDGAKDRRDGRTPYCGGLRADRTCGQDGGGRWHHARGYRARRRF